MFFTPTTCHIFGRRPACRSGNRPFYRSLQHRPLWSHSLQIAAFYEKSGDWMNTPTDRIRTFLCHAILIRISQLHANRQKLLPFAFAVGRRAQCRARRLKFARFLRHGFERRIAVDKCYRLCYSRNITGVSFFERGGMQWDISNCLTANGN